MHYAKMRQVRDGAQALERGVVGSTPALKPTTTGISQKRRLAAAAVRSIGAADHILSLIKTGDSGDFDASAILANPDFARVMQDLMQALAKAGDNLSQTAGKAAEGAASLIEKAGGGDEPTSTPGVANNGIGEAPPTETTVRRQLSGGDDWGTSSVHAAMRSAQGVGMANPPRSAAGMDAASRGPKAGTFTVKRLYEALANEQATGRTIAARNGIALDAGINLAATVSEIPAWSSDQWTRAARDEAIRRAPSNFRFQQIIAEPVPSMDAYFKE